MQNEKTESEKAVQTKVHMLKQLASRLRSPQSLLASIRSRFPGTLAYWERRYRDGGTSGAGSFGQLAQFKAEVLNSFVGKNQVQSVIEFGCGDGNQLALANYPSYVGLDVSRKAIEICGARFNSDNSKSFFLYVPTHFFDRRHVFAADVALSLDVIYHLVENEIFELYMGHLFQAGRRFVIIYSSNLEGRGSSHERMHRFTDWVIENAPEWELLEHIPNRYPFDASRPEQTSPADFYIYQRRHPVE